MPKLSSSDLAQSYGFAYSFLQSDPSLKKLFSQAVKGSWTAEKFSAELKNTPWYQKNSETARQWQFLTKNDAATANQRLSQTIAQLNDAAAQMGAHASPATLKSIATNALMYGWNDSQIKDQLAGYVRAVNGTFTGTAETSVDQLKQAAWRNGLNVSGSTLQNWASQIARGAATVDFYVGRLRQSAKTLAPSFAADLDAGMDLYDIASPYIQSKAKILEVNPAQIDLFDRDIRAAMSSKTADGKPASKSLWQFEQDIRANPQWLKTQNAQDSVMQVGHKVLQDLGLKN